MFEKSRLLPWAAGTILGCTALAGCGSPATKTVDCIHQPGAKVSVGVDIRNTGPRTSLAIEGQGAETFSIDVWGGQPNKVVVGVSNSPVGVSVSEKDVEDAGPAGVVLFANDPESGTAPPYYTTTALGDPNPHVISIVLACAAVQVPPL